MKKDYGLRMKELREEKGLTQKQACKILRVSISSLSTYERNVREPNIDTLVRMADLYNTTVDYITYREKVPILSLQNFSASQQEVIKNIINSLDREFNR